MQMMQRGSAWSGGCFVSEPRVHFVCPQREVSVVGKEIRFKAKANTSETGTNKFNSFWTNANQICVNLNNLAHSS